MGACGAIYDKRMLGSWAAVEDQCDRSCGTQEVSFRSMPSGEAAGQLHELAQAGGVEIVDAPGELDDAFTSGCLEPCRKAVADFCQVLGLADGRRSPFATRAVAAG